MTGGQFHPTMPSIEKVRIHRAECVDAEGVKVQQFPQRKPSHTLFLLTDSRCGHQMQGLIPTKFQRFSPMFSSSVITRANSVNTIGGFGISKVLSFTSNTLHLLHLKRRTQQLTLSFATEGAGLPLWAFHYYNRAVAGGLLYM